MENEQCDGREAEVCPGVSGTGMEHERTVRALRDRTRNRVCVVEALSGGGMGRVEGEEPSGAKAPNQTAEEIEEKVLDLREAHLSWGPRKLK